MCQWIRSALVQIMACRLIGTKPLPEPMLTFCLLDPQEQTSVKFKSKFKHFIQKMRLKTSSVNGSHLVQERWVKEYETARSCVYFVLATWWLHQMETFSMLLVLCAGNSPFTSEFPAQRPVMRSFDIFFDLRINGWVNNCEAGDLRRNRAHYDITVMSYHHSDKKCCNSLSSEK